MPDKQRIVLAHDTARHRAAMAVMSVPYGYVVTIEPPKRSADQNAALHALIGEIAQRCEWAGQKWDAETWKRLFVAAWARHQGVSVGSVPALDGQGVDMVPVRTSKLTRAECSDLMEFISAWSAEHVLQSV